MYYIGIPTINNMRYLQETIESLISSEGNEFKLYIIDNGSNDGKTRPFVEQGYKDGKWEASFLNNNIGVSKAWNNIIFWGMSHNDCDAIFILNNDIVLGKDSLDNLISSVMDKGYEGISGVNIGNNPLQLDSFTQTSPLHRYNPAMNFSCFGLTVKTIKRVGMFDEGFVLAYFEDNDYHHRMNLEGIKNAADTWAPFSHYGSRSIKEGGVDLSDNFLLNRAYFKKKWGFVP